MKIITHTSTSDREWSKICIESQQEYAEKMGLKHQIYENLPILDRSTEWSRFRAIQGFIMSANLGEIAVWMDSDLMIMNPEFDIKSLLSDFANDKSPICACVFALAGSLDPSLVFMRVTMESKQLFEYGWDVGEVEARGERRDKLSFDLMNTISPDSIRIIEPIGILSHWYPTSPMRYFNHRIDSAEGQKGLFSMKKPKEMIEGFRDLYIPGTFAVHLRSKGAHLLKLSEDFLAYKKTLLLGVEESRKIMKDL